MHAFVINMQRSVDRRLAMTRELEATGLAFEFFPAVDGRQVDRADYPVASKLSAAELGCYLSHVAVWRCLAESSLESALILEDDVCVSPDIAEVCDEFGRLNLPLDGVRVSSLKKVTGRLVASVGGHQLLLANMHPSGTQGYWLTRSGARRLLDILSAPDRPIDKALDRYWQHGLRLLLLAVPLVHEISSVESTIGLRPSTRKSYLPRKIENLQRRLAVWKMQRRMLAELSVGAKRQHSHRIVGNALRSPL